MKLDKRFSIEQFEATVSQSKVPFTPLTSEAFYRGAVAGGLFGVVFAPEGGGVLGDTTGDTAPSHKSSGSSNTANSS